MPLFLLAFVAISMDALAVLLFAGVYGLDLLRNADYGWADRLVFGNDLESKVERLIPPAHRNDSVRFPGGSLHLFGRPALGVAFAALGAVAAAAWAGHPKAETPASAVPTANLKESIERDDAEQVSQILAQKPQAWRTSWDGESPVHLAVKIGSLKALKALLDAGSDPNLLSTSMETPLHVAAARGSLEAATLLVEHGANRRMKDKYRRTAFDIAQQQPAVSSELVTVLKP